MLQRDDRKTRALTLPNGAMPGHVPILGDVTAGQPILAYEQQKGFVKYQPNGSGDHFALLIMGESMINAGIYDGDYVIVRKQQTAENGQIVVAMIDDEATVKRYQRSNGEVWLMPENDDYEPIDGSECQILGIVTALVREY
jgi:repressor LexA